MPGTRSGLTTELYVPLSVPRQHGGMWIAAAELLCWVTLGLVLGFALHWWKAHADRFPDQLDKDDPLLNMALTEYSVVNYVADSRYDDVGYWEYYSLRNLFLYVALALLVVLVPVYATAEGHAHARGALCSVANVVKLKPIFCL